MLVTQGPQNRHPSEVRVLFVLVSYDLLLVFLGRDKPVCIWNQVSVIVIQISWQFRRVKDVKSYDVC